LASDSGFPGVVIKNELKGVTFKEEMDTVFVTAGAGEPWDAFVETVVGRGLFGLENLSGIPGTVGAAPVQNIGAYGAEAKDTIVSVEAVDMRSGKIKFFSPAECDFGYRNSFFKTPDGRNFIVSKVTFGLKKEGKVNIGYKDLKNYFSKTTATPSLSEVRDAVLLIRKGKFPDLATTGTAGSFFKNPIVSKTKYEELKHEFPGVPGFEMADGTMKVPLAWILDNILHIKGKMDGHVGLYKAQPLVVVNDGAGTSRDVIKLVEEVAAKVKEATGIELAWEVEHLK
jgi:UDP-N-acetylmuramate dehydrogenase